MATLGAKVCLTSLTERGVFKMMNLIYSFDEINKILFDFNKLTNFRIALFDNNFTEFLSCPTRLSRFCKTLREDITLNEKCHRCDFEGFVKCTNERKTIIYQCHMGMTEIISPIISSDTIIGYVMCGQFFRLIPCTKNGIIFFLY